VVPIDLPLRVVQMPPPSDSVPQHAAEGNDADRLRGRMMGVSLRALLDQVRGSREAMPHLAALEAALMQKGAGCIERIPPHQLARMHSQLRVLPVSEHDASLVELHERMLRARGGGAPEQTMNLAPFDPEATVVISEGSHSEFMNALEESRAAR
jgi:hypothetical protein